MAASAQDVTMMVDNLAPDLRDRVRQVLTPQGTSRVASSDHFVFIICHLLQGSSPGEVSSLLFREKQETIAPYVIRDYQLAYIPAELIRPNMVLKHYQRMESTPEINLVDTAIKMQSQKVAKLFDVPMTTVEERESARRDMELLLKSCVVSVKLKQELGVLDALPHTQHVMHDHKHVHEVNVTPAKATAVTSALSRIRQLVAARTASTAPPIPIDVEPEPV